MDTSRALATPVHAALGPYYDGSALIGDRGPAEEEKRKIVGSEVLVLNALRREQHPSHFTLDEAIALAQELKCKTTYFTHISHQLGLHHEVEKELPDGIRLGYDGLQVQINE